MMRAIRYVYNFILGLGSLWLAYWSLKWALEPKSIVYGPDIVLNVGQSVYGPWRIGTWTHEELGKLLVGFWGLGPPLFFWFDWFWLGWYADDTEREIAKHTHDLSRNIWIALVAILTVLFAINLPFEH
jgi:hypothetical protein